MMTTQIQIFVRYGMPKQRSKTNYNLPRILSFCSFYFDYSEWFFRTVYNVVSVRQI